MKLFMLTLRASFQFSRLQFDAERIAAAFTIVIMRIATILHSRSTLETMSLAYPSACVKCCGKSALVSARLIDSRRVPK